MSAAPFTTVMEPLWRFYGDPATVSVRMTEPGCVIVEQRNGISLYLDAPELTIDRLTEICATLAAATNHRFDLDVAPFVRCIIPGTDWFANILLAPIATSGVNLSIYSRFRPSADQSLGGESADEQDSGDDDHYPGKDPETSGLDDVARGSEEGTGEQERDDVFKGHIPHVTKEVPQPFHLSDPVLVANISLIVVVCSGNWKFASGVWISMLATLAVWSALLWADSRKHRNRGEGVWTTTRVPQTVLGNDPIFRPLKNAVLLIAIMGTALARMPQSDPPQLVDDVTPIAPLLGFLCAWSYVEAWLRTRVLPKEAAR